MERAMKDSAYNQINLQQDGMQICLLFPKKPEKDKNITQEVKSILSYALREQLKQKI